MNTGTAAAGNPMYAMACALVNSGFTEMAYFPGPETFCWSSLRRQIVTCRVEDGLAADMETFPVSVVNYPVTNLPPLIEQLEDRFFRVGETSAYQITATDPDYADMVNGLTFKATLNGLPSYQYGPWMEQIINPITGTISLTPQFEATMTCIVTVTDPRGAQAVGHFNIFCVNPVHGSIIHLQYWKSSNPRRLSKLAQLFTISDLHVADPDNQQSVLLLQYRCCRKKRLSGPSRVSSQASTWFRLPHTTSLVALLHSSSYCKYCPGGHINRC